MSERYLGTREFAKLLGVSRVTVIKWIKGGRVVAYSVHGSGGSPTARLRGFLEAFRGLGVWQYTLGSPQTLREMTWRDGSRH